MVDLPTAELLSGLVEVEMAAHGMRDIHKGCFFVRKSWEVFILGFSACVLDFNRGFAPLRLCSHLILLISIAIKLCLKINLCVMPGEPPQILGDAQTPVVQSCPKEPNCSLSRNLIKHIGSVIGLIECERRKKGKADKLKVLFFKDNSRDDRLRLLRVWEDGERLKSWVDESPKLLGGSEEVHLAVVVESCVSINKGLAEDRAREGVLLKEESLH